MTVSLSVEHTGHGKKHPLAGLLVAQALNSFNDNAWKQIVTVLVIGASASVAESQRQAAIAQMVLMVPLIVFNLPGGTLADRLSKRTVILGLKALELVLMILGTAALWTQPSGGWPMMALLGLLGMQAALLSPSKYGILPELLPHEKLSSGNGLLEMWSNLALIGGTVAGGVLLWLTRGQPWVAGLLLVVLSGVGLAAATGIPHVPAARPEGKPLELLRSGWGAIREDRILRLAIAGQVFVWSIACLIPPPILAHAIKTLNLHEWQTGLPLAALGIGIGAGSVVAGRLSSPKVEYGLVPMGAIGLTLATLAFGLAGPGLAMTLVLMVFLGFSAGLVFVPLNALIQWRSPADRRGAVIALANVLANIGMLGGSILAMGLASAGFSAQGTFLLASAVLALGTIWALREVPDAFLRFVLIILAATLYRVRVVGRANVPLSGPALLTPNHVSFADGLFIIASIDRPIRFVVYAEYFKRPLLGRFLRAMKAIPIASRGGPRMILEAFREAGKALDHGELVCIFPEGEITRTGMTNRFQRGLERIVKDRDVPIIPAHIDRATASVFSPTQDRWLPERIPLPVTISFSAPLPATTPPSAIRQAIGELDQQAWEYRRRDRRPLHHEFIREVRKHPFRLALVDPLTPELSCIKALAGAIALARGLRSSWSGQTTVGIMLPTSVGGCLANVAAALSGRVVVNINFTAGKAAMSSAAAQSGLTTLLTSRKFVEKANLELPDGVEPIWIEDLRPTITRKDRAIALALAVLAPVRMIEKSAGAIRHSTVDDTVAMIFSSGSEGDPKGVVLSHFNVDSNIVAIGQVFHIYPNDRILDVLPLFHSFGYLLLWLGACKGMGLICHLKPQEAGAVGMLADEYRATVLFATPAFLHIYTRRCEPAQFGSLRLVVAGADKMPEAVGRAFEERFGIKPLEGYGMTECSPVVAVNAPDFRAPGFFQPGSRRGTVGHPLPGVSVRVIPADRVAGMEKLEALAAIPPVPAGTEGMLLVRGPNVMSGYLNRDDLTRKAICDDWYVTGDLGMVDEDGFVKITGRLSRFSKIGGEMVPHGQVEEALNEAIDAEDLVFGVTAVSEEHEGDRLVVLHTASDEQVERAMAALKKQGYPNLFIPRRDHFVRVDALPMLGTGKLDLRELRRQASEALSPVAS